MSRTNPPSAWRRPQRQDLQAGLCVALIAGGLGLLLTRSYWDSYDASIMGQVAINILNHHSITVQFDPYHLNSPHSFYGLGMSLLMIPTILVARVLGRPDIQGEMLTNAWLLGVLAATVYVWARIRELSMRAAAVTGLAVGLGGGLLAYASTGMAEVALAVAVAGGMLGIAGIRRGYGWGAWLTGACAGLAVVVRDDSALLVAPWLIAGALLSTSAWKPVALRIVGSGLPFLAIWCWYNDVRYGEPWKVGYQGVVKLDHSFVGGLYGLLLSPGRGLVLYVPLVLVALAGTRSAWRRDRIQLLTGAALLGVRVLFFAPYWGWYGGGNFGPRYILSATPVLAVGLMEVIRRWDTIARPWQALAGICAGLSLAIGVVGGAVNYEHDSLETTLAAHLSIPPSTGKVLLAALESPHTQSVVDRYMDDWSVFPITNEASLFVHRQQIAAAALARPADKARDAVAILLMLMGVAGLGLAARPRGEAIGAGPITTATSAV